MQAEHGIPPALLFFFFSSRRRHTRYWRDWSSDVCSSDLIGCNNATFGDPNFGVAKSCDYRSTVGSGGFSTAGWTQCASENGTCSVTGQGVYGGKGWVSQRQYTGSIPPHKNTLCPPPPPTGQTPFTPKR